jgi:hypothetical protein
MLRNGVVVDRVGGVAARTRAAAAASRVPPPPRMMGCWLLIGDRMSWGGYSLAWLSVVAPIL